MAHRLVQQLLAPLADALLILCYLLLSPLLAGLLARGGLPAAGLVGAAYALMCGGLLLSKRLALPGEVLPSVTQSGTTTTAVDASETQSQDTPAAAKADMLSTGCLLGLSLPFCCFVLVMLVMAGGLLDEQTRAGAWLTRATGSQGGAIEVLLITLAALCILGGLPAALLAPRRPRIAAGTPLHVLLRFAALLAVNCMALATAAFWDMYLAGAERMHMALGGRILVWAVVFPLFLLFYAPPRLVLLSLEPSRLSLAGYLLFLAVYVWRLTA